MEITDTAAILLLDLPNSALGGIDLLSFTTTPRFRGVKDLPDGLHLVFVGSSTAFSERHGVWFNVLQSNNVPYLVVTKWDAQTETLIIEKNETEVLRWRANLSSIWREGLTPYRQAMPKPEDGEGDEDSSDWTTLISSITTRLLSRITGSVSDWKLSSASSSRGDLEEIPGLTKEALNLETESELHFLPVDLKQTWREGATGRERTDAAQDRTWALENLIKTFCNNGDATEIIGELQFCFLMVLTLNNFSCFEQWKRILSLLFTCKNAVSTRSDLFVSAIVALRIQLQHCKDAEGGLIDLADEGGSLLKGLLVRFRKGVDTLSGTEVGDVLDELDDLEGFLSQEHGWQFGGTFVKTGLLELQDGEQVHMRTTAFDEDDETGEFAPQIVDLTPEQARMLGVQDEPDLSTNLTRTSFRDTRTNEVEENSDTDDAANGDDDDNHTSDDSEGLQDLEEMDARF